MNINSGKWIGTGALLSALSVALGAFAAHGLKERIPVEHLAVFEVAVRYQFYHSLALILLGSSLLPANVNLKPAAWLFLSGIILFSGSLYLLSLRTLFANAEGLRALGAVTPFGGLCFIAGWLIFAYKAFKKVA